jgi:hypothetical protein
MDHMETRRATVTPMRVAVMVTRLNDILFPDTGKTVVRLLRRLASTWTSRSRRRAAGSPWSTPATSTRP